MSKSETKFNNSAIKMQKAMFKLLDEKDFQEISITNICNQAGVNRSTFYAHYDTTIDLLEETEKQLMQDFFNKFESSFSMSKIKELSVDQTMFISSEYLLPYLTFIKNNKKLFTVYMKNLKEFKPSEMFKILLDYVFIPVLKKHNITDEVLISYFAKYYLTGINAITMNWLERNCEDDIHFVSEIIIMCVRPNIE